MNETQTGTQIILIRASIGVQGVDVESEGHGPLCLGMEWNWGCFLKADGVEGECLSRVWRVRDLLPHTACRDSVFMETEKADKPSLTSRFFSCAPSQGLMLKMWLLGACESHLLLFLAPKTLKSPAQMTRRLSVLPGVAQPLCTSLDPRVAKERLYVGSGGCGLSLKEKPWASTCVCVSLLVVWERTGEGRGERWATDQSPESEGPDTDRHFSIQTWLLRSLWRFFFS